MKKLIMKSPLRAVRLGARVVRWYASFWGGYPRPLACGCYLTTRCNLACDFCNLHRFPGAPTLERSEALRLARTLGTMRCAYFSLSGGEPLLVPYAEETLAAAKEAGVLYTHMVSNGLLLDENRARALRDSRLDEVSISIDGAPSFHDRVRGREGTHSAAVAAIRAMRRFAPKTTVVVNTVVMPQEPEQALKVLALVEELKVAMKIQPRNFHPVFGCIRAAENVGRVQEVKIRRVMEALASSPRVINSRAFLRSASEFLATGATATLEGRPCQLGYHHLEVWPDGTVFPCLEGMGWTSAFKLRDWPGVMFGSDYREAVKNLSTCARCRSTCYVCYFESRLSFPIGNFLRFR